MSASTVLGDVTQTLVDLLVEEQQDIEFDVVVTPPGEDINPTNKPSINLYLFRVEENDFAQNRDWQVVGNELLRHPPLSLDIIYIMTPHAATMSSGDKMPQIAAYCALGEAMRIFYDHGIIGPPLLKGGLVDATDEFKIDLCKFNLEELTRIWSAFNQPYRLSVCYKVWIAFIDSLVDRPIQRVREKENQHV